VVVSALFSRHLSTPDTGGPPIAAVGSRPLKAAGGDARFAV